jgi:hypothetical protein
MLVDLGFDLQHSYILKQKYDHISVLAFCIYIRGATQNFGEFDHKKKFITVTPSFYRLL